MSYAAAAQDETEDRYHTQVEAGDVRLFTLDQLDAAFNVGLIHENTFVCLEGGTEWLTLGEVAGLGDEEPVSAPFPVAAPVSYYSAPPSVIPPAPYSVAPMVMPRSIAPVVNDLSFDDDYEMMAMRPKRRIGKVLAMLTVVGLAAAGFAVVQSGGIRGLKLPKLNFGDSVGQATAASLSLSSLKDAARATPQPPTPAPEAAKPEPPKVEEAKPADAAPTPAADTGKPSTDKADADKAEKKTDDRFSEDMKAALLNKDKQHVVDQKHKTATRVAVSAKQKPGGKPAKGSPGFKSGGSAYDPLNGKL
jgi:hypothetical protein